MRSTSSYPVQTSRIGYTTNYGNGFNSDAMYGYPQQNSLTQGRAYPQPARALGDTKASNTGSETVTVDGYSATISYEITGNLLGWVWFTITYSDGTSETYWGTLSGAKSRATEVARQKAQEEAERLRDEAMATPIGEPLVPTAIILTFYAVYKRKHKKDT